MRYAAIATAAVALAAGLMWWNAPDVGPDLASRPHLSPPAPKARAAIAPPTPPPPTARPTPRRIAPDPQPAPPEVEIVEPDPSRVFDGGSLEGLAEVAMARSHRTEACYRSYVNEYGEMDGLPALQLTVVEGQADVRLVAAEVGGESFEDCLAEAFADARFAESTDRPMVMRWSMPPPH